MEKPKPSTVTSFLFFLVVFAFLAVAGIAIAEETKTASLRRVHEKCRKSDIQIDQAPTHLMPNGIPTYTVEITNTCVRGCNISQIHLNCGWFSSARLVNPKILKRLAYNDCLVNDGKPLLPGRIVSFQYATTFLCPLTVSSVVCNHFHNG